MIILVVHVVRAEMVHPSLVKMWCGGLFTGQLY